MADSVRTDSGLSFEDPPVTEVAIGVQFAAVRNLGGIRSGQLWERWRNDYPETTEQPWLPPWPAPDGQGLWVQFGAPPGVRTWFLDVTRDYILQIQNDRLIANWRRVSGASYPRFPEVRGRFFRAWEDVKSHASDLSVDLRAEQIEVSYINAIASSPAEALRDWSQILGGMDKGRMGATFTQAISHDAISPAIMTLGLEGSYDGDPSVALTLSVRGTPTNASDLGDSVAAAHDLIVNRFSDVTAPSMHRLWRAIP
jgi:hypothetical protein